MIFWIAALYGTFAFKQVNGISMLVTEYLELNMPGTLKISFY